MTWKARALHQIAKIHAAMPEDTSPEALRKEPRKHSQSFHGGTSWGKKVWPKACREYIKLAFGRDVSNAVHKRVEDSPLFSAKDHAFPFRDHQP